MKDLSKDRRVLSAEELERLAALVGPAHLIASGDDLAPHARDWTEGWTASPCAVARPRTTAEVAALLAFCNSRRIPVTPRSGRTGMSGGALPIHGGLALSLDRMSSILEIDTANLVAVVEPGVMTQTLHEAVEELGLSYPPDPGSRGSCHIGGNVAENAGGPHAARYGVTGKWVLGLEAVFADGSVTVTGGKSRKGVSGYDLTSLLVGSEGTLAVVTKAWLRLIPKPATGAVLVAPFATLEEAVRCVVELTRGGLVPAALELVDRPAVEVSFAKKGLPVPFPEAEARLLVELDGAADDEVERAVTRAGEIALECGALDVVLATDEGKRRALWDVTRGIGEAVRDLGPSTELDVAVPRAELVTLVHSVRRIAGEAGLGTISFGHAGEGNLHVHVYRKGEGGKDAAVFEETVRAISAEAARLGGTVTGQHGVGIAALPFLPLCRPPAFLAAMRAIKGALDPNGILNPGKLVAGWTPPAGAP